MPRITLVGYRGAGKSTVAAILAERLGVPWLDADVVLEERQGCSIAAIVGSRGEAAFRDAEAAILDDLLGGFDGVFATGGGVVLRPGNRRLLRDRGRPVAWLTASADVIRARLAADPTTGSRRPPLAGREPLDDVADALTLREPLYREVADAVFDTGADPPPVVASRILAWLDGRDGGAA